MPRPTKYPDSNGDDAINRRSYQCQPIIHAKFKAEISLEDGINVEWQIDFKINGLITTYNAQVK
jgi:hypothetical protein